MAIAVNSQQIVGINEGLSLLEKLVIKRNDRIPAI